MPLPRTLRSFRLLPQRPVGTRLAGWLERVQFHCRALEAKADPVEPIHQLRLVSKALRAVLRLADNGQPKADLMQRDRAIRRWATQVSRARDCEVQGALLKRLARKESKEIQSVVDQMILRHLKNRPATGRIGSVRDGLCTEAARLSQELPCRITPAGIGQAIRHSVRKTQAWRARAVEERVPEDFHAWRRWQKRLEAQLRLVGLDQIQETEPLLNDLHELQEELGALHDADELAVFLARPSVWKGIAPSIRKAVLRLLADRQESLRKRLVKDSRKVLGSRLKRCCKATARLWENTGKAA